VRLDREIRRLASAVVERAIIDMYKVVDEDICFVEYDILNGGLNFWLEILDLSITPDEILKKARRYRKEKQAANLTKSKKSGKIKLEHSF
jgi:hypothetical protein